MKTCSDALKSLFNLYRVGERRTWYIAELYTFWLNSSERVDRLLAWRPYLSDHIAYANAKFGLGLYDAYRSEADVGKPLIRSACPPRENFDWNNNDWTIEYFIRYTNFGGELMGNSVTFSVTDSTSMTVASQVVLGFAIGSTSSSFYPAFCFWVRKKGEAKKYKILDMPASGQELYSFKHMAVSKQGRTIYAAREGAIKGTYTLENDEELAMPASSYMNISMGHGDSIVDEVRVSSCARYTSNYTVPTGQFVSDGNTLSLLHLNGNLDDEGNIDVGSSSGEKDFRSGEIYLYTGHDTDLLCGGNKYQHIAIEHGDIEESRGTETATMDLIINYDPNDTITPTDDRTWFRALKDGVFDRAYVSLDRLYSPIPWQYNMPNISTDYVLKSRFFGRMDVQEVRINGASIQVKSPTDMLTRELPRNLIKPSCQNHFGDFMCQMSPEQWRTDVVAQAGSTRTNIVIGGNYSNGLFDNGMIYCISGANAGQHSSIKYYSNNTVVVYKPFYEDVSAGDRFYILRGCDKTMRTCRDVFGNIEHFRGFPFLPCKNVLL